MADTKIEWAEKVWNPITGCTPISEGCAHCYAKRMANRLRGRYGYPYDYPFRPGVVHYGSMGQPFSWSNPSTVFVCSMGDLFHEAVPMDAILKIFGIMNRCRQHIFIVLTKRPERMVQFCEEFGLVPGREGFTGSGETWPENVIAMTTAENQRRLEERVPHLLRVPATVRGLSIEPMLGPVDLNADTGLHGGPGQLDWVIVGGESGPGARPMHPDWARAVRDRCRAAGVPFFFKQWGAWSQKGERVGKKAAGRILDGRTYDEIPVLS